ncbi:aldo/keto reductase [Maricaulis salignorans]|uniref:Predicted oxidoreductase n=1 Tax=Maricaulis salignorans TaxID=144026 RepID=A0A1G9TZN1_9PROT|nr:aldo/keto reductase [Maricaulis salignorans]SDM53250.1 Predicted oxidoreductase [Maricaulis salignorans]
MSDAPQIPATPFSRLGFGVTGPHASPAVSRRETARLIAEAIDLGINLFDTGPAYGRGEGERRLGQALRGRARDQLYIATKAGIDLHRHRDFSAGAVEMSLRGSLERLQTPYVDLLLLHGPSAADMSDRLLRRLEALRERGMIRQIGVCGRGPELDAAIDAGAFDILMAPVNAGLDAAALTRLARASEAGMQVIGIEAISGAARARPRLPASGADLWYLARAAKQVMTGTRVRPGPVPSGGALKWTLDQNGVSAVVCLTTRSANLAANARLAGLEARSVSPQLSGRDLPGAQ